MQRSWWRLTTVALVAVLLAGCMTTQAGIRDQVGGYTLASVDVTIDENVHSGVFARLDDIDDEELARQFEQQLETVMYSTLGSSFSGEQPVHMSVHVNEMNIASDAGRAFFGSESYIGASVSVLDATTREVIAERYFREQEKDVSFTGNIGILVEITKNVIDAGSNDMLDEAIEEFAESVKVWLDT